MQDRNSILLPGRAHGRSKPRSTKLSILRVFSFQSHTLRSGAVVLSDQGPPGTALLFLKGAPDVIKGMVQPASVPPDFQQVTNRMHVMGTISSQTHLYRHMCLTAYLSSELLKYRRPDCP